MCQNCPMYAYTMEELVHEEQALANQSRWYDGSNNGLTWIYKMVLGLQKRYYGS